MIARSALVVLAVLGLGLAYWLIDGTDRGRQAEVDENQPSSGVPTPAQSEGSGIIRRSDPTLGQLFLFDEITKSPIAPPSARVFSGTKAVEIVRPVCEVPFSTVSKWPASLALEYRESSMPSAVQIRREVNTLNLVGTEPLSVTIPFRSMLKLHVFADGGQPLKNAEVEAAIIDTESWQFALDVEPQKFALLFPHQSTQYKMLAYEEIMGPVEWVSAIVLGSGQYSVMLEGAGTVLARATLSGYQPKIIETRVSGGTTRQEELILRRRPLVRGTIYDFDGTPAESVTVYISVVLSNDDYDFFLTDRDSGTAGSASGTQNDTHRLAVVPTVTDSAGYYSRAIPFGEMVAVTAFTPESYVFTPLTGALVQDVIDAPGLTLVPARVLTDPDCIAVVLLDNAGSPRVGAKVQYTIPDDEPWERYFPEVVTDGSGRAAVNWIQPGANLGFLITLASGESRFVMENVEIGSNVIILQ